MTSLKLLHLDIETAPIVAYAWGLWDQNISISQIVQPGRTICWAANWHNKKKIMFDSEHESKHEDMIKGMHTLLDEADAVVHFNGKKFDIPTLNAEFAKIGLKPPSPFAQIDLYQVVKSNFKLASNKLDYVCQYFGIGSKLPNKGMELWRGCMAGNDADWKVMKAYNKHDVRLLPLLYKFLLPWIKQHPNMNLYTDIDRPTCTRCDSTNLQKRGFKTTMTMIYQRYRCMDCGHWMRSRQNVTPKKTKENLVVSI